MTNTIEDYKAAHRSATLRCRRALHLLTTMDTVTASELLGAMHYMCIRETSQYLSSGSWTTKVDIEWYGPGLHTARLYGGGGTMLASMEDTLRHVAEWYERRATEISQRMAELAEESNA